jgi:hypothetical protein
MEQFLTWEMLGDYITFVGVVLTVVAYTKNAPIIKLIPTRLWSVIVSFLLLMFVNIYNGTFEWISLVIYILNAVMISATANGISDANNKKG